MLTTLEYSMFIPPSMGNYHHLKSREVRLHDDDKWVVRNLNEKLLKADPFVINLFINQHQPLLYYSGKINDKENKQADMMLKFVRYSKCEVFGGYQKDVFFAINENDFFVIVNVLKENTNNATDKIQFTISKNEKGLYQRLLYCYEIDEKELLACQLQKQLTKNKQTKQYKI